MINNQKGFTLIELLIVIGIISVLAVAVVVVINPAELLAQARDSTRLSDLGAINSAIGLYMVDSGSPDLGSPDPNCNVASCAFTGAWSDNTGTPTAVTATTVDGNGWVEVNFSGMSTGSPLPRLPLDPSDTTTYFYAYHSGSGNYELNANMESDKFENTGGDDVESTDGGDNDDIYEVGTDLTLM